MKHILVQLVGNKHLWVMEIQPSNRWLLLNAGRQLWCCGSVFRGIGQGYTNNIFDYVRRFVQLNSIDKFLVFDLSALYVFSRKDFHSENHCYKHDSEAPDVDTFWVAVWAIYFRSSKQRRADLSHKPLSEFTRVLWIFPFLADVEVDKFYLKFSVNKNILRLYVSMSNS